MCLFIDQCSIGSEISPESLIKWLRKVRVLRIR